MKSFLFVLLTIFLFSCKRENKQFDVLKDQSIYQLIAFDEGGEKPLEGNYMATFVTIADTLGDTVHYVPSYHYFIEFYKESPIYDLLSAMSVGDSAHFIVSEDQVFNAFGFDNLDGESNRKVVLRIRLDYVVSAENVQDTLMAELSTRLSNEPQSILSYIKRQEEPQSYNEELGLYKKSLIMNLEGDPIQLGDQVTLSYFGQFFNGYKFDQKEGANSLEIKYGMNDQILPGLSIAIKGMRAGESVKIILPSHHAFGSRGSIKGIVPPYTPVVYNLSIKNVTRKNNNEKKRN